MTRGGALRTKRVAGWGAVMEGSGDDGTQWRTKVPVTFFFFPLVSEMATGPSASISVRMDTYK